jgi:hypothetical protein
VSFISKLATQAAQDGVSSSPPHNLTVLLRRLPSTLHSTTRVAAAGYSKVSRGLRAVLFFLPTIPPCLLIRSGGTAVPGQYPVWRVPQVSFLTILSIAGRKAGLLTVTLTACRRPLELLNPHDRIFQGRRERITTFALIPVRL